MNRPLPPPSTAYPWPGVAELPSEALAVARPRSHLDPLALLRRIAADPEEPSAVRVRALGELLRHPPEPEAESGELSAEMREWLGAAKGDRWREMAAAPDTRDAGEWARPYSSAARGGEARERGALFEEE